MNVFEYMVLTFVIIVAVIFFLAAVDLLVSNHATPLCFGKRWSAMDAAEHDCHSCKFIIPCDSAERKD